MNTFYHYVDPLAFQYQVLGALCRFVWNLTSSTIAGTAILKTKNA
jgi:hypothetical protein